jgi:hypothetical protein
LGFPGISHNFEDSYDTSWNRDEVYGRNDPIMTFKNTIRTITISLDVVSDSHGEGRANWMKMNELAQATYPLYENVKGEHILSTPPLFGLRFRNLVREPENGAAMDSFLFGVFDGVKIKPNLEEGWYIQGNEYYSWEDKRWCRTYANNEETLFVIPKSYTLDLTFTVIHSQFRGNTHDKSLTPGGPMVQQTTEQLKNRGVRDKRIKRLQNQLKRPAPGRRPKGRRGRVKCPRR